MCGLCVMFLHAECRGLSGLGFTKSSLELFYSSLECRYKTPLFASGKIIIGTCTFGGLAILLAGSTSLGTDPLVTSDYKVDRVAIHTGSLPSHLILAARHLEQAATGRLTLSSGVSRTMCCSPLDGRFVSCTIMFGLALMLYTRGSSD